MRVIRTCPHSFALVYATVATVALVHSNIIKGITKLSISNAPSSIRSRAIDLLSTLAQAIDFVYPTHHTLELLSSSNVVRDIYAHLPSKANESRRRACHSITLLEELGTLSAPRLEPLDQPPSMVHAAEEGSTLQCTSRRDFVVQMEASNVNSTKEWQQWNFRVIKIQVEQGLAQVSLRHASPSCPVDCWCIA